jgi:hypothetical protein
MSSLMNSCFYISYEIVPVNISLKVSKKVANLPCRIACQISVNFSSSAKNKIIGMLAKVPYNKKRPLLLRERLCILPDTITIR